MPPPRSTGWLDWASRRSLALTSSLFYQSPRLHTRMHVHRVLGSRRVFGPKVGEGSQAGTDSQRQGRFSGGAPG